MPHRCTILPPILRIDLLKHLSCLPIRRDCFCRDSGRAVHPRSGDTLRLRLPSRPCRGQRSTQSQKAQRGISSPGLTHEMPRYLGRRQRGAFSRVSKEGPLQGSGFIKGGALFQGRALFKVGLFQGRRLVKGRATSREGLIKGGAFPRQGPFQGIVSFSTEASNV